MLCALRLISAEKLGKRCLAADGAVDFDKDDEDAMDFVAAATNLRAHIFGIPLNSRFKIKGSCGGDGMATVHMLKDMPSSI